MSLHLLVYIHFLRTSTSLSAMVTFPSVYCLSSCLSACIYLFFCVCLTLRQLWSPFRMSIVCLHVSLSAYIFINFLRISISLSAMVAIPSDYCPSASIYTKSILTKTAWRCRSLFTFKKKKKILKKSTDIELAATSKRETPARFAASQYWSVHAGHRQSEGESCGPEWKPGDLWFYGRMGTLWNPLAPKSAPCTVASGSLCQRKPTIKG